GAPSAGTETLGFPTKSGNKSITLYKPVHPEDSSWAGYFVLPFEGGHVVHLGKVTQSIALDHAIESDVIVAAQSNLLFRLSARDSSQTALVFDAQAANALRVRTGPTSGLMMAASPTAQWSRLNVDVKRL